MPKNAPTTRARWPSVSQRTVAVGYSVTLALALPTRANDGGNAGANIDRLEPTVGLSSDVPLGGCL